MKNAEEVSTVLQGGYWGIEYPFVQLLHSYLGSWEEAQDQVRTFAWEATRKFDPSLGFQFSTFLRGHLRLASLAEIKRVLRWRRGRELHQDPADLVSDRRVLDPCEWEEFVSALSERTRKILERLIGSARSVGLDTESVLWEETVEMLGEEVSSQDLSDGLVEIRSKAPQYLEMVDA